MKIKTILTSFFLIFLKFVYDFLVFVNLYNIILFQNSSSADNIGVCAFLWKFCSQLAPCGLSQECSDPDHICVHHSQCSNQPVCYPLSMINENICPPQSNSIMTNTTLTTTMSMEVTTTKIKLNEWKQQARIVMGANGSGSELNQILLPQRILLDKDQNIFIADWGNHRIVQWKLNENSGKVVAGGNGYGNRTDQLNFPIDMIVDEENNSVIIADRGNSRVVRWFNETKQEILIENIGCFGLRQDKFGFLYVSDMKKNEVRKWKMEEIKGNEGIVVAGGNGEGNQTNQFDRPHFMFVDDEQSIYVSDLGNHRVMKWRKDAKEGIVVAGGNGLGKELNQLNSPKGIFVDDDGQVYVADSWNHRIMRWSEGKEEGEIIVGGNGKGNELNQMSHPFDLSFDVEGNLYISDCENSRISRFDLIVQ
ncbi:unnamed protein product [Adineta ricciae]|uniref:Uncharacterized protein n=1 Tax=Adineta ricciae TaxID=249248 RepID=A0A815M657_ADIRI|nr:unnamed protein product [Adineta ricciae]